MTGELTGDLIDVEISETTGWDYYTIKRQPAWYKRLMIEKRENDRLRRENNNQP